MVYNNFTPQGRSLGRESRSGGLHSGRESGGGEIIGEPQPPRNSGGTSMIGGPHRNSGGTSMIGGPQNCGRESGVGEMIGGPQPPRNSGGSSMIGGPQPPRSCLSGIIPQRMDVEQQKRSGWRDHGILVVSETDPRLGWPEREMINHLARKLFGQFKKEVYRG